ncbi:MAG: zinc-dependent metalloprotease [Bacteroidales bacterium]|nr:zinc-dependent metalloprotease [Bacteroidales bacterium]
MKFSLKSVIVASAMLLMCAPVDAKFLFWGKKKAAPVKADSTAVAKKNADKDELKGPVATGFFSVQKNKDDWYFHVPDSLLGRPFLVVTRFVSTPVEMGVYGGELVNQQMFYWEKREKNLLLRALIHDASCPDSAAIALALKASTENPIVASLKIEKSVKADSTCTDSVGGRRYVVKVTDLLKGDNLFSGIPSSPKEQYKISGIRSDLSYVDSVSTYPTNVEAKTVKTYASSKNSKAWSGKVAGLLTFRLNTSIVMLPQTPMRQRIFDPRVGYFVEGERYYSDEQQQVRRVEFATRWRLEPKDSADAERQKNGELIEPKKPIVYYIDPATPKQWRPYLILGVNDWNVAFEQAGWKNAIRAEEWPTDRPDMSMEDARYSVIRYLASPIANAYGPHISDPRTGEILNTCVGWYHNVMSLIHDWYMVQAGAVDPRARTMKLPDELMGQLIRFVSSHEVGHTLGLRHNMGASSATPVDSLRNKAWVEKNGHTASIMDYARFNYVAQPEDGIGPDGLMPRINVYDKWAIEWGYRYFADASDAQEEKLLLNRMTVERLASDRRLWFGGEGRDDDPCALTEDLSDDPMRAAEYGIRNLRRIIGQLPDWACEEADQFGNLRQLYESLVGQYRRYVGHATKNVAGLHHEYKSVEQAGAVYVPESKERTQRALRFIDKYALTEPSWLIAEPYMMQITRRPMQYIEGIGESAASNLFSASVMTRLCDYATFAGAYKPEDYVNDVMRMVFKELYNGGKVTAWRQRVQKAALNAIIRNWKSNSAGASHTYFTMMLTELDSRLKGSASADKFTKAHCEDMRLAIKNAFEGNGGGKSGGLEIIVH